ncbi:MAG: hypothetical protein V1492_00480 [Candidatus Micrarchaeota archaeon]
MRQKEINALYNMLDEGSAGEIKAIEAIKGYVGKGEIISNFLWILLEGLDTAAPEVEAKIPEALAFIDSKASIQDWIRILEDNHLKNRGKENFDEGKDIGRTSAEYVAERICNTPFEKLPGTTEEKIRTRIRAILCTTEFFGNEERTDEKGKITNKRIEEIIGFGKAAFPALKEVLNIQYPLDYEAEILRDNAAHMIIKMRDVDRLPLYWLFERFDDPEARIVASYLGSEIPACLCHIDFGDSKKAIDDLVKKYGCAGALQKIEEFEKIIVNEYAGKKGSNAPLLKGDIRLEIKTLAGLVRERMNLLDKKEPLTLKKKAAQEVKTPVKPKKTC